MNDIARLVIDFSPLTSIIQSPPNIIPDISASLQNLQGKALFSAMDLRYAYLALKIDEKSKPLTTFLTPTGAYQWLSIPTGAACSPAYFVDAVNRILHYKPVLDNKGKPIFDAPNKVRLQRDVMKNSFHYFDDIICSSENKNTYKSTLDFHFNCLEKIIERLNFHNVKLSVNKSEFAKSSILFLGWIVSHNFLIPDPRRMEKIKQAEFPKTKKELRSFLGLVNSIRRVVPLDVIKESMTLTPLTSSSKNVVFEATEKHKTAFEKIKRMLLTEPLFCNLIDEKATKFLWVDAASSSGCLGAVLAQKIESEKDSKILPTHIDLDNEVHQIIYDRNLNYEPCKLYTSFPTEIPKPSALKTVPPKVDKNDKWFGHNKDDIHNSLFWSLISIYILYGCKLPNSINEIRKEMTKEVKKGILGIKLKDESYNNQHAAYRQYLHEFDNGLQNVDKNWYLIEALAKITHRCVILLSTLKEHEIKGVEQLIFNVLKRRGRRRKSPQVLEFHFNNK
jgi:Reverse transcriptase (RNA-dependent DNA polymerase)